MFSLLEGVALIGLGNFGIALTLCCAAHCKVHPDLCALARKIILQALKNLCVNVLSDADDMFSRIGIAFLGLHSELRTNASALRAFLRGRIAFIDITTDRTNKLFHD